VECSQTLPFFLVKAIVFHKQCSAELLSSGPRFSKERYLWNVPRLCPFPRNYCPLVHDFRKSIICGMFPDSAHFRGTTVHWSTIFERALSVECSQTLPICPSGKSKYCNMWCFSNSVPRNRCPMVHDFRKNIVWECSHVPPVFPSGKRQCVDQSFSKQGSAELLSYSPRFFFLVEAVCRSEFLETGFSGTSIW